jgi:hypothetical protein
MSAGASASIISKPNLNLISWCDDGQGVGGNRLMYIQLAADAE